jgi:D-sedoheptulose 7-phosphate isomerase
MSTSSVSGNSPNLVKAMQWARKNGLCTMALVGNQHGILVDLVEHVLVISDTHYGHVEDAHMIVCHMITYALIEELACSHCGFAD